mmetsp:Transcript_108562/g.259154  ORF Transcript_108562/g.259154 Transcript_108562/m.259154 type:complete len:212 (+) Transcript_108562:1779-2414(+)
MARRQEIALGQVLGGVPGGPQLAEPERDGGRGRGHRRPGDLVRLGRGLGRGEDPELRDGSDPEGHLGVPGGVSQGPRLLQLRSRLCPQGARLQGQDLRSLARHAGRQGEGRRADHRGREQCGHLQGDSDPWRGQPQEQCAATRGEPQVFGPQQGRAFLGHHRGWLGCGGRHLRAHRCGQGRLHLLPEGWPPRDALRYGQKDLEGCPERQDR